MATHGNRHLGSVVIQDYGNWHRGYMNPFWSKNSYTKLDYKRQPFNNTSDLKKWHNQGYTHKYYTGLLCDMNSEQPKYVPDFINWFAKTYNAKNGENHVVSNTNSKIGKLIPINAIVLI